MNRTLLAFAAGLVASAGFAQSPPLPSPVAPPVEEIAPPTAEMVEVVSPVETLVAPRLTLGGDIGTVFGGWGMWRAGTLTPPTAFAARPLLFPVPTADYAHDVDANLSLAARITAAYTFEWLPVSVSGSWEAYHRHAETLLLGYDLSTAQLLHGLNEYNKRVREADNNRSAGDSVHNTDTDRGIDHRDFPRFQMRTLPSDTHRLRSRVAVNVADFTLGYKLWTPREASGVEYRLLAGGRYGGFFADDRAVGNGYEQSGSNWFGGFGPHGGLRVDYRLPVREARPWGRMGVWFDARGGALFGQITQRFREFDAIWGGATPFREVVVRADRTVPFVASELGVGSQGWWLWWSVGVRYSHYWGVGNAGASRLNFGAAAGFLGVGVGF